MSNYWNQIYQALWEDLWKAIDEGYYDDDHQLITLFKERWTPHKNTREWDLKLCLDQGGIISIELDGVAMLKYDYFKAQDHIHDLEGEVYDLEFEIAHLTDLRDIVRDELLNEYGEEIKEGEKI